MSGASDRPLIGICASRETASWTVWERQPAILVGSAYVDRVQEAGGSVVIVAPDDPTDLRLLDSLDGLLLPGGLDLDPAAYGREREPGCESFDPARDDFELALARAALERDIPLLGICRGLQVINVALGGTLHQDLAMRLGSTAHREVIGSLDGRSSHGIVITAGSAIAGICADLSIDGRSHHHQAIDSTGRGVSVTGISAGDGIPEAIEVEGRRFAIGVQWHAEATPGDRFIPAFVRAAASYRSDRDPTANTPSTSTIPPSGRAATATAARAGGSSPGKKPE